MWARANYCVCLPVCWFACLVVCQFPFVVRGEWDYLLFNGARVQAGWALAFLATSQLDLSLPRWRTSVPLTDSMLWWPCSDSFYWGRRSHLFFFQEASDFRFWKLKSLSRARSRRINLKPLYLWQHLGHQDTCSITEVKPPHRQVHWMVWWTTGTSEANSLGWQGLPSTWQPSSGF